MVITVIIYILSHIIKWVSRVAPLVAQRIDYRLRPNAVCSIPVQAQTLLCGSPAQERCWPTTCAHSLAMNTRHNNPIVSQRACHWEDHPSSSSSLKANFWLETGYVIASFNSYNFINVSKSSVRPEKL